MFRCTVTWVESAQDELAELWMAGPDRDAISAAARAVDRELAVDPHVKGVEMSEGLRALHQPPLRLLFSVRDDDRVVEVLRVKRL